jgi:hypothetical protein
MAKFGREGQSGAGDRRTAFRFAHNRSICCGKLASAVTPERAKRVQFKACVCCQSIVLAAATRRLI